MRSFGLFFLAPAFLALTLAGCGGHGEAMSSMESVESRSPKTYGYQIVLLSQLQDADVTRLKGAVSAIGGTVEIGFAPFQFKPRDPWKNANALIAGRGGTTLRFIVHLAFHRDDDTSDGTAKSRMKSFCDWSSTLPSNVTAVLSPCLEDEWTDAVWAKRVKLLSDNGTPNIVRKTSLRRSCNAAMLGGFQKTVVDSGQGFANGHASSPVPYERHGSASVSGGQPFSNDGFFVFDGAERQTAATGAAITLGPAYSLADFGRANGTPDLLWLPGFNLFSRDAAGNFVKARTWVKNDNTCDGVPANLVNDADIRTMKRFAGK